MATRTVLCALNYINMSWSHVVNKEMNSIETSFLAPESQLCRGRIIEHIKIFYHLTMLSILTIVFLDHMKHSVYH